MEIFSVRPPRLNLRKTCVLFLGCEMVLRTVVVTVSDGRLVGRKRSHISPILGKDLKVERHVVKWWC